MTSEIRANIIKNRVGLGTIEYSNTGPIISGVTTALNFKTGTSNLHNTGLNVQDLDVDGHTNLDNGNVAGIVTFNSGSALHMNGGQLLLFDRPDGNSNNLFFGTGGRAVAYHDGTGFSLTNNVGHAYIGVGVGSKDLYLYAQASGNVLLQQNTGVRYVKGVGSDASVQLFFNNNLRLNTTNAGVSIPKDLDVDGHTNLDNVSISGVTTTSGNVNVSGITTSSTGFMFGTNGEMYLYKGATNTATLRITSDGPYAEFKDVSGDVQIGSASGTLLLSASGNEKVRIDGNGNMGLGTNSLVGNAANVYFTVNGSTLGGIALKANGTTQGYLQGTSSLIRLSSDGSKPITFDTNGSERVRIDSSGKLLINSSTVTASIGGKLQLTNSNFAMNSFANNPHAQTFHFTKSRGTSGSGGTIVQDNDFCGHIEWYADDGVDTASQIAKISARINGTPGANDTPGELIFHTTADGANASTERLRIEADGRLVLSNSGGIQLSPVASNLYQINGALSYYAANNAVYLNGAGDNGLLRLNATGQYNDRTSINLYGKDVGGYGDTITFRTVSVERARINSSGDLMVGTTSDVSNVVAIFGKNHNNTTAISVENTDTNSSARIRYEFKNGSSTSYIEKYNSGGWYMFNGTPSSSNPNLGLYSSSSWISLRLRPGDVSNDIAEFYQRWGTSNGILMNIGSAQSGTAKAMRFLTSHYGGERGYIGVTLGGTSYNSSSDYRMKQDVVDLTGAIDRVKSFKPRRFKWKEDPTYTVDGFLAHEASTVVPESVDGEKDAVDSNGDPKHQVMDNSKLVPVLTAALKEAIAKIETLETKVAALESS